MDYSALIEALLFYKNEPVSIRELARMLSVSEEDVRNALKMLEEKLQGRGFALMQKDDTVALATAPEAAQYIEALRKEELSKELGKAALETLTIIIYRAPVARAEIEYVRGVNSTFILRNLLVRGLIEKIPNKQDQRSFLYRPTVALLSMLGITRIEEMPEYATVQERLQDHIDEQRDNDENG